MVIGLEKCINRRNFLKSATLGLAAVIGSSDCFGTPVSSIVTEKKRDYWIFSYEEWKAAGESDKKEEGYFVLREKAERVKRNPSEATPFLTEEERAEMSRERYKNEIFRRVFPSEKNNFSWGFISNEFSRAVQGAERERVKSKYGVDFNFDFPTNGDLVIIYLDRIYSERYKKEPGKNFCR